MTASSDEEDHIKTTPELITLLEATRRVLKGIKSQGRDPSNPKPYEMMLKTLHMLEESVRVQIETLKEFERDLAYIASLGLTRKQRTLLAWLAERYEGGMNYTTLITRLSEEMRIPSSTIRWNLRFLRDAGLITAGHRDNKGIPVRLTRKGLLIAENLIKRGEKQF